MLEKILPAYGWRISGFRMRTSKRAAVESKDSCGSVIVPQLPMVLPKDLDNFMEYLMECAALADLVTMAGLRGYIHFNQPLIVSPDTGFQRNPGKCCD
jgi:hypothetical protein